MRRQAPVVDPTSLKVAVIVVCYHSSGVIQGCIDALDEAVAAMSHASQPTVTLVLIANSAEEDIADVSCRESEVIRLRAPGNVGFSPAVNLGLEAVPDVDFVLLLNPDARLAVDCLEEMVRVARGRQAALVGPVLIGSDGQPHGASERPFHSLRREVAQQLLGAGRHQPPFGRRARNTGVARCLTGACLLADRRFLHSVDGLDTTIRMYLEDVMLCWNAHLQHRPVVLAMHAQCRHALGGSSAGDDFRSSIGLRLTMLGARVEFVRRRSGRLGAFGMRAVIAMGAALRCILPIGSKRQKHLVTLRWAVTSGDPPRWRDGPVLSGL
jgi:GT2 family glycosyltransferase